MSSMLADALVSAMSAIALDLHAALNAADTDEARHSVEHALVRLDDAIKSVQAAALRSKPPGGLE